MITAPMRAAACDDGQPVPSGRRPAPLLTTTPVASMMPSVLPATMPIGRRGCGRGQGAAQCSTFTVFIVTAGRLRDMHDFFAWLAEATPALMDRWEYDRPAAD
jgi:hypothetical protein